MNAVILPIVIITILIVVNGFFVAAEFAIAATPRTRVAQMAEAGSTSARRVLAILRDTDEINRYLSTAQVGITIASLGLGMYGEHVVAEWLLGPLEHLGHIGAAAAHTIATILAVTLLTYLHVVVGEMVPKSLALQSAADAAVALSASMAATERLFRPLTSVLNWAGNSLLRLAGMPPADTQAKLISTQELAYIVEESSEEGLLEPMEQLYLENVFDFHERSAGQIMTPRTRMLALDVESDAAAALALVCDNRHSRYPVFESDRDHIIGILHIKDLARHILDQGTPFDLRALLRPAVFVPETLSLEQLLVQFRNEHAQVAIVVDEYGGTAGLVTLEDLAEELIGEIQDEFDRELPPFREVEPGTLRVRGDLLLAELTQHYDIEFPNEEADTVGGLIMEQLGRVAQAGETVTYQDLTFEVETVDGLAIDTALVYLPGHAITDAAIPSPE